MAVTFGTGMETLGIRKAQQSGGDNPPKSSQNQLVKKKGGIRYGQPVNPQQPSFLQRFVNWWNQNVNWGSVGMPGGMTSAQARQAYKYGQQWNYRNGPPTGPVFPPPGTNPDKIRQQYAGMYNYGPPAPGQEQPTSGYWINPAYQREMLNRQLAENIQAIGGSLIQQPNFPTNAFLGYNPKSGYYMSQMMQKKQPFGPGTVKWAYTGGYPQPSGYADLPGNQGQSGLASSFYPYGGGVRYGRGGYGGGGSLPNYANWYKAMMSWQVQL